MNLVPKSVSRAGHRTLLKLSANSPTILVVAGVVGLGASAVLAAKATRSLDPILMGHQETRFEIKRAEFAPRDEQKALLDLYFTTGVRLTRLYGPALFIGTCSAASVLGGHKILRTRHVATMAAYSGLMEQFKSYRGRVAKTLGEDVERGIFNGAHGEWEEDPDHKGEYKLTPKEEPDLSQDYLRPFFDETNPNWRKDHVANYLFLKGVQTHMNNLLQIRGHVFVNDVYDALCIDRCREGQVAGWLKNGTDEYVDLGFMSANNPASIAFLDGDECSVRLNLNIDGLIYDKI